MFFFSFGHIAIPLNHCIQPRGVATLKDTQLNRFYLDPSLTQLQSSLDFISLDFINLDFIKSRFYQVK